VKKQGHCVMNWLKIIPVRVVILIFSNLAVGGLRNLRNVVAYIVWLGMGKLRVRTEKLLRNLCKILVTM